MGDVFDELRTLAWSADPPAGFGPVVGVIGRGVPLELLDAAGARPHRLRGPAGIETGPADHYLGTGIDPMARATLAHLLARGFDQLDAIVASTDCEASARLFYLLRELSRVEPERGIPELHLFDALHDERPSSLRYTARRLAELRARLEAWTGRPIADASLATAMTTRREVRRRIADLHRRSTTRAVSGADVLAACAAQGRTPGEELFPLLARAAAAPDRAPGRDPNLAATPIVLSGSEHDGPGVTDALEAAGLAVVGHDHGAGVLGLDVENGDAGSPIDRLARRVVADGGTAQKSTSAERGDATAALAEASGARAVVVWVRAHDEAPLWDVRAQRAASGVPVVVVRDQERDRVDAGAVAAAVTARLTEEVA